MEVQESINQQAFDNVKATIAKEVVLAYLDFTKPFEMYTDASTMQLGAVITQGIMPIALFSRKVSKAKMGFTKCTANEFVQSHFQDCFLGVLYIKKHRTIHLFVCV